MYPINTFCVCVTGGGHTIVARTTYVPCIQGPSWSDWDHRCTFRCIAPTGVLPYTLHFSNFTTSRPMTDMAVRPRGSQPGVTYRWFGDNPVLRQFGFGLSLARFAGLGSRPQQTACGIHVCWMLLQWWRPLSSGRQSRSIRLQHYACKHPRTKG